MAKCTYMQCWTGGGTPTAGPHGDGGTGLYCVGGEHAGKDIEGIRVSHFVRGTNALLQIIAPKVKRTRARSTGKRKG
jgi:hypothetical protein